MATAQRSQLQSETAQVEAARYARTVYLARHIDVVARVNQIDQTLTELAST
jgi:hypothetical protein